MKKILIYAQEFFPYENANTNVLMPILQELKKQYCIDVLTVDYHENLPKQEWYQGINILRYCKTVTEKLFATLLASYDMPLEEILLPPRRIKQGIWKLMHATFSRVRWHKMLVSAATSKRYLRQLRTVQYAPIISFSAPITAHYDTLLIQKRLPKGVKWLPFFSDPHATFIGYKALYQELMKKEIEIYHYATAVFTTQEIYTDNAGHPLLQFRDKTIPIPYANLRPLQKKMEISYTSKDKIVCVYTGSLFSHLVRNPEYLYKLANACTDEFEFHIVCYCADNWNLRLKEKYVDKSTNIIWHNHATMEECTSLLCCADILLNLGNLSTNQVPSKIFDYLSSGKPIVNIHPLENDTANLYLKRYPLFFSILEKETLDPTDVYCLQQFCKENYGRTIAFETVKQLYKEFCVEAVALRFSQQIEA